MGSSKKRGSPNRVRRPKDTSARNANRPIAFDKDKYNNPTIRICPVFRGEPNLTCAFDTKDIPAKSFQSGVDSPPLHESFCQATLDYLVSTLARVANAEGPVVVTLQDLVSAHYLPASTGDSRYFQWAVPDRPNTFFDPIALTKYIATRGNDPTIVYCYVPDYIKAHWRILASSISMNLSEKHTDDFFEQNLSLLSPKLDEGFNIYKHLKETGSSPVKNFRETITVGPDGFLTSSIVLFHNKVALDADGRDGNPTVPPSSVPPQDGNSDRQNLADTDASSRVLPSGPDANTAAPADITQDSNYASNSTTEDAGVPDHDQASRLLQTPKAAFTAARRFFTGNRTGTPGLFTGNRTSTPRGQSRILRLFW